MLLIPRTQSVFDSLMQPVTFYIPFLGNNLGTHSHLSAAPPFGPNSAPSKNNVLHSPALHRSGPAKILMRKTSDSGGGQREPPFSFTFLRFVSRRRLDYLHPVPHCTSTFWVFVLCARLSLTCNRALLSSCRVCPTACYGTAAEHLRATFLSLCTARPTGNALSDAQRLM